MKKILKNKYIAIPIIILLLCTIGITYSYFSDSSLFSNKFKTATYDVSIEEEFYNDWGTKKVFFVNNEETNTPVVLRINYNETWTKDVDGIGLIPLSNNVEGKNVVIKEWTEAYENDFIQGPDGWYYYKKLLDSQDSVQVLESITLDEELIEQSPYRDDYLSYDYELSFNFEATQASEEAVKSLWGYGITINGENITWEL